MVNAIKRETNIERPSVLWEECVCVWKHGKSSKRGEPKQHLLLPNDDQGNSENNDFFALFKSIVSAFPAFIGFLYLSHSLELNFDKER